MTPGDPVIVTIRLPKGEREEKSGTYVGPYHGGMLPSCLVRFPEGHTLAVFLRDVRPDSER